MNIYQKLIEVRKVVPYLKKENSGQQYDYVSSSQVLGSLKRKMDELNLLLVPQVLNSKVQTDVYDKNTKKTWNYFTEIEMEFTWINADNPQETLSCKWYGQGLDTSGEKGVGKALTYAEKYFMLKFFNIPTDKDDPDSFQQKHDDDTPKQKPSNEQKPPKQPQKQQGNTNSAITENEPLLSQEQKDKIYSLCIGDTQEEKADFLYKSIKANGYEKIKQVKSKDFEKLCNYMLDQAALIIK